MKAKLVNFAADAVIWISVGGLALLASNVAVIALETMTGQR